MAIVINGSGTVTGLAVGGLPDGTVDAGTLATNSVDSAEIVDGSVDRSKLNTSIADSGNATAITIDASENVSFSSNTKIVGGNQQTQRLSWWNSTNYELASIENKSHTSYNDSGGLVFRTAALSSGGLQQRLEITSDGRGLSQFTAKAWVRFNGDGTVAINDSHNVSSITDIGVGQYYVNFANNLANGNYAMFHSRDGNSDSSNTFTTQYSFNGASASSTSKFPVCTKFNGSVHDSANISALVFGD